MIFQSLGMPKCLVSKDELLMKSFLGPSFKWLIFPTYCQLAYFSFFKVIKESPRRNII